MANKTYAPKIPFNIDKDGNILNISDALENCKQNLKMVIMTNPGEKLMDPFFGAGIRKLLFENKYSTYGDTDSNEITAKAKKSIISQTNKYIPDVTIQNIEAEIINQALFLKINYIFKGFYPDSLSVNLAGQQ